MGSGHLGKSFGKLPLGKNPLGKYLKSREDEGRGVGMVRKNGERGLGIVRKYEERKVEMVGRGGV